MYSNTSPCRPHSIAVRSTRSASGGAQALAEQAQERLLGQFARGFLLQAVADVGGERHVREQLPAEQFLAQGVFARDIARAQRRQVQVAVGELRQAEQRHGLRQRQQLVVGQLGLLGQPRQVGAAVEGVAGEQFQQAFHARHVGLGQALAELQRDRLLCGAAPAGAPDGHQRIDLVDQLPHLGALGVARARQLHRELEAHPPRVAREDQHAVGHQHRFLDVVRDHQDRLGRHRLAGPQFEDVARAGVSPVSTSRAENGLVHQQHLGLDDERARDAHALAHPAREFARQAPSKPVSPISSIAASARFARSALGDAARLQPEFDVVLHRQPREQREGLEHHADAARRAVQRLVA